MSEPVALAPRTKSSAILNDSVRISMIPIDRAIATIISTSVMAGRVTRLRIMSLSPQSQGGVASWERGRLGRMCRRGRPGRSPG